MHSSLQLKGLDVKDLAVERWRETNERSSRSRENGNRHALGDPGDESKG